MHKNQLELEMAKIHAKAASVGSFVGLAKHILTGGFIMFGLWLVMNGLKEMATGSPLGIRAVAELVKSINLSGWVGYVWGGVATGGMMLERRGKKRLLKGHSDKRKTREQGDAYHGTSGLTETGDTPSPNRRN